MRSHTITTRSLMNTWSRQECNDCHRGFAVGQVVLYHDFKAGQVGYLRAHQKFALHRPCMAAILARAPRQRDEVEDEFNRIRDRIEQTGDPLAEPDQERTKCPT